MAAAQRGDQGGMDLRRYELATLAAARRLRSSYCVLAHGTVLADQFLRPGEALAGDRVRPPRGRARRGRRRRDGPRREGRRRRDLDHRRPTSSACARSACPTTDVFDVVLAAAARCFFSKTLDGSASSPTASSPRSSRPARRAGRRPADRRSACMTPLTGSCACGAVAFEITAPFQTAGYCHCKRCQSRSGAMWSANAMVAKDGPDDRPRPRRVREWDPPGEGLPKAFCDECGGHLWSVGPDSSACGSAPSTATRASARSGASGSSRRPTGSRSRTTACSATRSGARA